MDKQKVEGLSQPAPQLLKAKNNIFSCFDLPKKFQRLPIDLRISLQYTSIALLFFISAKWFAAILGSSFFSSTAGDVILLFVTISALLVYLLVRYAWADCEISSIVQKTQQQHEQRFEARSNELTEMLTISQRVNARLEELLADQAAIAVESERLYEEVGQTAVLEERHRLGRDLHDSVTQSLYSMVLFADATGLALAAGKQTEARENLHQVRKMARQAMADMRLLIYQLHPPLLKKEGLAAALQNRLEAVESRAGLQTEFRTKGECVLSPTVAQELYQIAQEVLNNVIKHAKAENVIIDLNCSGDLKGSGAIFCMTISDDGVGFDVATAQENGGIGLRGIAERAQQIHAIMTLQSSPNRGTTVRIEV